MACLLAVGLGVLKDRVGFQDAYWHKRLSDVQRVTRGKVTSP